MDQQKADKFAELSPVLELVYVMLTNMAKYMDVYATDIEAEETPQFVEAKEALNSAIKKFDTLYGLKSPASATADELEEETPAMLAEEDDVQATPMPTAPQQDDNNKPYNFASGDDQESLKKAKQAVDELKTLFADMKKQEQVTPATDQTVATPAVASPNPTDAPIKAETPIAIPVVNPQQPVVTPVEPPMPTFVAPTVPSEASAPADAGTASATPAPTVATQPPATVPPAQDATEIDSILAELKKLQNKGTPQL